MQLPTTGSSAGTWDRETGELYLRDYGKLGFQVVDVATGDLLRSVVDNENVGENSRTGSFLAGSFYTRTWDGPLQEFDGITGERRDTGATPQSDHTATDSDHGAAMLYVHGYGGAGQVFHRYNPADDSIVRLADSPNVSNHSTITVMR